MHNFGIPNSFLDSQKVKIKCQINHMYHTSIAPKVHKYFRVVKNSQKHKSCHIFKRQQTFDVFIIWDTLGIVFSLLWIAIASDIGPGHGANLQHIKMSIISGTLKTYELNSNKTCLHRFGKLE